MALPMVARKVITANGLVDSTNPIVIYSVHTIATSGGATVASIKDGGSSGTVQLQLNALTSATQTLDFAQGLSFPSAGGAYVTVDGNTSAVIVTYQRIG